MAYRVLEIWLKSLKISDRKKCANFIITLLQMNNSSGTVLDMELIWDIMARYCFGDCLNNNNSSDPINFGNVEKSIDRNTIKVDNFEDLKEDIYIYGNIIISIIEKSSLFVDVIIRRPSGIFKFNTKYKVLEEDKTLNSEVGEIIDLINIHISSKDVEVFDPRQSAVILESSNNNSIQLETNNMISKFSGSGRFTSSQSSRSKLSSSSLITPTTQNGESNLPNKNSYFNRFEIDFSDFIQAIPMLNSVEEIKPISLPKVDQIARGIRVLDIIPTVNVHKIGVDIIIMIGVLCGSRTNT